MSVTVRVPTVLRTYTSGAAQVSADGSNLREVLDSLDARYPGIRGRIVDERDQLRRFVNVYVGDDDVRSGDGLATQVPDAAEISIVPSVAGG